MPTYLLTLTPEDAATLTGPTGYGSGCPSLQTVVRAKIASEAVPLLDAAGAGVGPNHFKHYWSITGNREQLCACTEPGVWVKGSEGWEKA